MALVPRIQATMVADDAITNAKLDTDLNLRIIGTSSGELGLPADNSVQSWAHNIGSVPSRYRVVLRCVSAQYGYNVGDEIDITSNLDGNGGRGTTTKVDATNVYARSNTWSGYYVSRYDGSPNTVPLTAPSWRIVFRAWK